MMKRRIEEVIVITTEPDGQLAYVLPVLTGAGLRVVVVDPMLLPEKGLSLTRGLNGRTVVCYGGFQIAKDPSRTAVWMGKPRPIDRVPVGPDWKSDYAHQLLAYHWRDLQIALRDCCWVSDPTAILLASSKPYQLGVAEQVGLNVPEWAQTNANPREVITFLWDRKGMCVSKPVETGRFTAPGGKEQVTRARLIRAGALDPGQIDISITPWIFEQYIPGRSIRVTLAGSTVFAAEQINTDPDKSPESIDIRDAVTTGTLKVIPHELPPKVASHCRKLVRRLGLRYGAIDLILDEHGV